MQALGRAQRRRARSEGAVDVRWIPRTASLFAIFWLVLSGHYTALLLTLGALSVALVCLVIWRADVVESQHLSVRRLVRLPAYLAWLGVEVLRSAVGVARLAWARRIDLQPVVGPTPLPPMSPLGQVTYANSITVTPGTLALDVDDDLIRVHSLQAESLDALRTGRMLRRVQRLEGDR